MNNKELGIYIHIPFCKKKCYYCDFVSYPNMKEKQKEGQKRKQREHWLRIRHGKLHLTKFMRLI